MMHHKLLLVVGTGLFVLGCGDGSTEADRIGIGWECTAKAECDSPEQEIELECLTQFKGGYCGLEGCDGDDKCPEGSACVTHDDGVNYCFRVCVNKYPDCNYNRPSCEANCVGSVTFVDLRNDRKACEPPSADDCPIP
jgi:hypothetical protein